jgi:hypothetical protein
MQCIYAFLMDILAKKPVISLKIINWLHFVMVAWCIFSEVETAFLNIVYMN